MVVTVVISKEHIHLQHPHTVSLIMKKIERKGGGGAEGWAWRGIWKIVHTSEKILATPLNTQEMVAENPT